MKHEGVTNSSVYCSTADSGGDYPLRADAHLLPAAAAQSWSRVCKCHARLQGTAPTRSADCQPVPPLDGRRAARQLRYVRQWRSHWHHDPAEATPNDLAGGCQLHPPATHRPATWHPRRLATVLATGSRAHLHLLCRPVPPGFPHRFLSHLPLCRALDSAPSGAL